MSAAELDLSIVVPTYEEAENLPSLVGRIEAAVSAAGLAYEVIVVDDASPDDTEAVCARLAERFPLRLVVRTAERGLSTAVLAGFERARGERVVVMDADLSHPPEQIPALVAALDGPGVDFVVGSRYVAGGSTEEGWGLLRQLNSRVASALARPLTRIRDPMAGFFGIRRRRVLAARERLDPVGYKIGLELLVKCECRGVVEVPIRFARRHRGRSKLDLGEQLAYLRHLARLYRHRLGRGAFARARGG